MPKIDYRRTILPDIEMYGGNTDQWEIPLYRSGGQRLSYDDALHCTFTLVIKDYGYTHRTNGMNYFTLVKSGYVTHDTQNNAILNFDFTTSETFQRYGKYIYQVIAEDTTYDVRNVAQGNLFITKAIDQ